MHHRCCRTLLAAYPDYFKQEWFTPEAYLWAVELWYAYAIQVNTDGSVLGQHAHTVCMWR
jgi:hypothetical protein